MKTWTNVTRCLATWLLVGGAAAMSQPAVVEGDPVDLTDGALVDAPPPHWIGIGLGPVSPTLRSQLGLVGNQGVVVQRVVEESPAAVAGLREHDVITAVDGALIETPAQLAEVVALSGGKPLEVTYFRGGNVEQVQVSPSNAPRPVPEGFAPGNEVAELPFNLREFFQGRRQGERPFGFRRIAPPMIFGKGQVELPAGVSVSIRREGAAPAEVTVKRGDEVWELTEDQVDQLPEDLQPFVLGMLGRGDAPFRREVEEALEGLEIPELDVPEGGLRLGPDGGLRIAPPQDGRGLRQRLERLEEEFRQLRKRLLPAELEEEDGPRT